MPPATAASKASATPASSARRGEAGAVLRHQRLVGGDDVLLVGQRGLDDVERDPLGAADQLDDDVDVGVGRHRGGVLVPAHRRQVDAAVAPPVAGRDGARRRCGGRRAAPPVRPAAPTAAGCRRRPCRARQRQSSGQVASAGPRRYGANWISTRPAASGLGAASVWILLAGMPASASALAICWARPSAA